MNDLFVYLFKSHLLLKKQREEGRDTRGFLILPHDAHTEVDVILGPQMDPGTGHLGADIFIGLLLTL